MLETYSQELLKVDAKISQGEDVIQFFKAQTQDLDPCFPEDRCEILFVFFVCVSLHKNVIEKYQLHFGAEEQRCSTQIFYCFDI